MKISSVRVTPIAFKDPPLLNASGIHEPYALRSIIEIETNNGLVGLGETYGDAPVLEQLLRVKDELVGLSPFDLNGLRKRVVTKTGSVTSTTGADLAPGTQGDKAAASVFSAFEVAFLDLQARHLNMPLCELLGGAVRDRVPYSAYLFFKYAEHIESPYPADPWGEVITIEQLVREAKTMIDTYGFGSIKLKAGVFEPDFEVSCIKALHAAFPKHPLRLDPNANWSVDTATRIARELGDILQYYEDPTPTLKGMAELRRRSGSLLATNMVVTSFDEFRDNAALNAVQIVLSDHHYWGGLRATQTLATMCETFGIGLSMHSNSHLGISLMAMTHIAAATPNLSYACDTHYPWQTEDIVVGGRIAITDGCVKLTNKPGLGVELDREATMVLHEQYQRCGYRQRNDTKQMKKYKPDFENRKGRY